MHDEIKIFSLGDSAVTAEFGHEISVSLNNKAVALSKYLDSHPFSGYIECVPAYASTTVYYDIYQVKRHFPEFTSAFEAIKHLIERALALMNIEAIEQPHIIEIPVKFDSGSSPDLKYVAQRSGLGVDEVIEIFIGKTYRVYMLGFLPGFSYMGEVDERIATPRRDSPRISVPKGSVGIAGRQTGVYSLESPGGWQIIGRTDLEMFAPKDEIPCRLAPGKNVRFVTSK